MTTADGEYILDTAVAIAPAEAMDWLITSCVHDRADFRAQLEVTIANDSRPDGSLPSRASLTADNEDVEGEVLEIRSHLPGFTLTTDSLPAPLGTPTSSTFFDITWAVDDCSLATSPDSFRTGSHVGATVRAEIDGQPIERSIQRSLPEDVFLQLGLLAASSCPS